MTRAEVDSAWLYLVALGVGEAILPEAFREAADRYRAYVTGYTMSGERLIETALSLGWRYEQ